MKISSLTSTSTDTILHCFNEAFSDYVVPFRLTSEQLEAKMKAERVNLDYSVGTFDGDRLVGFILHGVKDANGVRSIYNGGTGVIPSARRAGLTVQMYDHILPILRPAGIHEMILEVIAGNAPAIKSYERIGYKTVRMLDCYKGDISVSATHPQVEIRHIHQFSDSLTAIGKIQPTWQNSAEAIEDATSDVIILGAYLNDGLCGYCACNVKTNRILQIAVSKSDRRQKIGSTLLHHIAAQYSPTVTIINVDARYDSVAEFLAQSGFVRFLQQHEMRMRL